MQILLSTGAFTRSSDWLWSSKAVRHVHLKDSDNFGSREGRHYMHPGEGQINFLRFVQQLKGHGYDGALSLEARGIDSKNEVEIERIRTSLQFMRNLVSVS